MKTANSLRGRGEGGDPPLKTLVDGSIHRKTHHGIAHVLVRRAAKVTRVILRNATGSNLVQHASKALG